MVNRMARYIDADALIDDIRKHSESYFADDFAHEWVDKQPSADAKPIQHGNWIKYGHHITCDQCGQSMCDKDHEGDTIPQNFCPNCGADMRGKQNG